MFFLFFYSLLIACLLNEMFKQNFHNPVFNPNIKFCPMYSNPPPYQYSSPPLSPRSTPNINSRNIFPNQSSRLNYTANEVSRIVNAPVRDGEVVKGQSRINYVPYEKKVIEYEDRQRVERVPRTRKIIEYEERVVVEQVPREVTVTDYYAVQNITEYYKEVVPEKKIQIVPIEKKRKRVEYIPVEKQIVHYPEGHDKSKSRVILGNQGIAVRNDAQFRKIDSRLLYQYSNQRGNQPVGYYEDGVHRNMSTAPTYNQNPPYFGQQTSYLPVQQPPSPNNPYTNYPPQANYPYNQPQSYSQSHIHQTIGFHPAKQSSSRDTYVSSNNQSN